MDWTLWTNAYGLDHHSGEERQQSALSPLRREVSPRQERCAETREGRRQSDQQNFEWKCESESESEKDWRQKCLSDGLQGRKEEQAFHPLR